MKKVIFIFILALFVTGCVVSNTVFEKEYSQDQQEQSIRDIYSTLWVMNIDSVPIAEWMTFQGEKDQELFVEQVYFDKDPHKDWLFTYRTYYGSDTIYYHYKIVEKTRNKSLLSPGSLK